MSKECPTCGASWIDSSSFKLPVAHPGERYPYSCPVCHGTGHVAAGFYSQTTGQWSITTTAGFETCRSCGGGGVIWG
jgi:DnaJ-class molecular chaperone